MKRINIILLSITMHFTLDAFCQSSIKPIKGKLKITDAYIFIGNNVQHQIYGTLGDFQKIAPQSVLLQDLKKNSGSYSTSTQRTYNAFSIFPFSNGISYAGDPFFNANIGISMADKEKTKYCSNPLIRIGVTYFSQTVLSSSFYTEDRKRFDTLTIGQAGQSGQVIYSDSVTTRHYYMDYNTEQIRLDASIIFRTKPEAFVSIYGGLGIEAGTTINAYTEVNYFESAKVEYSDSNNTYIGSMYNDDYIRPSKYERFKNQNCFGLSVYMPMGIDFRMGKREFFKRLHAFYEVRPSINITYIPELRGIVNVGIKHGAGIRVAID